MKKLSVLLVLFILISCNRDNPISPAPDAVISPSGVVFAKNKLDLTERARIVLNRNDIVVTTVAFMESKVASSIIVDVETKTGESLSNFVIARGRISYNTENLIIKDNRNDTRKGASPHSITITCEGCENCGIQGTIEPDGTHHFECKNDCCKMRVTFEETPKQ